MEDFKDLMLNSKILGLSLDCLESDNKSKANMASLEDNIYKTSIIEPLNYNKLSREEIIHYSEKILCYLTSNTHKEDFIKYFLSIIKIIESDNYLDSSYNYDIETNSKIMVSEQVNIPNTNSFLSVAISSHEFGHFVSNINRLNLYHNYHHVEILSIVFEKITANVLNVENIDINLISNLSIIRLNSLKKDLNKLKSMQEAINILFLEDRNTYFLEREYEYANHLHYKYLIGYMYGTALYYYYLQDEKKFIKLLKKLVNERISIYDLLAHYGVSARDKKTLDYNLIDLNKVRIK